MHAPDSKLQRIFNMDPSEVAGRGRQEAFKVVDRFAVLMSDSGRRLSTVFQQLTPAKTPVNIGTAIQEKNEELAGDLLLEHFHNTAEEKFFAGVKFERIGELTAAYETRAKTRIIQNADAIYDDRFDILGYGKLSFGQPVDWHLDPVSGTRAPRKHWSRLDPLDRNIVGDSKVIWELNRHQWLLDLGQAYCLTGDERYAEIFVSRLEQWMRSNPPGVGLNWASSLEVSMRLISWCWALILFRNAKVLTGSFFIKMLAGLRLHASHIERYLSVYFSPNTHLTGEALGLFYMGLLFPVLKDSERWLSQGIAILGDQIEQQVHEDGVYFEQSTRYQYYTAEIYFQFLLLARRNDLPLPPAVDDRLQKMMDFLLAVCRPDGSMPQIGDADGGWLLPLVRRAPGDCRGLFSVAAAVFNRMDFAFAAGGTQPEKLWLLGAEEGKTFVPPVPPDATCQRLFPDGRYVVMRSGWDRHAHHLIADVGPLGCRFSAGHGHADLLSVQCSAFGQNYLVDPGTCCYTADPQWRDYFRSTAAHNTVTVDGRSQAIPGGPFSWQSKKPKARLNRCESSKHYEMVDAEHDGYEAVGVVHRRRVMFVRSQYWIVVDDLSGTDEHRVDLCYQFAPLSVRREHHDWVRASGPDGSALLLRAFSVVPLDVSLVRGHQEPIRGWYSPDYGRRMPAPSLAFSARAVLPLRIVTVITPCKDQDAPPPDVRGVFEDQIVALVHVDSMDVICIQDDEIRLETSGLTTEGS